MKIECKRVSLIGSPEPRWGHTSITLPNGSGFIVFGGNSNRAFNDIQYYNIQSNTWSKIEAVGNTPSERYGHSAVLYQSQNRPYSDSYQIIFFGGRATSKPFSDINILYVNSNKSFIWKQVTNKSVEGRAGHTSVVYRNYLVVFGGHNNHKSKYYNSVLLYNLDTNEWKQQTCNGVAPSARATHCTFQINNKMFIFGGYDGKKYYNDIYYLDLDTFNWRKIDVKGVLPKARSGHSATLIQNNKLMIFGGCGSDSNFLNDIHLLHIDSINEYRWEQPQYIGMEIPQARFRHTTNFIGGRMYIYAGTGSGNLMGDLHQLEFFDDNNHPLLPSMISQSSIINNSNNIYGSPNNQNNSNSNLLSTSNNSSSYLSTSPLSASSNSLLQQQNNNINHPHHHSNSNNQLSQSNELINDTLSDNSLNSNITINSNNSNHQQTSNNNNNSNNNIPILSRSNSNISLNSSTSSLQSLQSTQTTTTTTTTTSQQSNRSNYSNSNRSSISIPHSQYSNNSGSITRQNGSQSYQQQQQHHNHQQYKTNSAEELILEELRSLNIYDQAAGNKDFQNNLKRVEDHFNHKIKNEQKYRQTLEEKLYRANHQISTLTDQIQSIIQKDELLSLKKEYNDLKKKHSLLYSEDIDDLPTEQCLRLEEIHVKSLEKLRVKKLPQQISNQTIINNNGSVYNSNNIVSEQTIICNNSQISTQLPNQLLSTQQLPNQQLQQQQQQQQQLPNQQLQQQQIAHQQTQHRNNNDNGKALNKLTSSSSSSSLSQKQQHRLSISSNSSILSNTNSINSINTNNNDQYYEQKIKELQNQLNEKNKTLAERDIQVNSLTKQLNKFKLVNADTLDIRELLELESTFHNNLRQISTIKDQIYSSRLLLLEKEKDQLKDQNSCVICVTNVPNILLLPCRHSSICSECCVKLTKCPICRSDIKQTFERFVN